MGIVESVMGPRSKRDTSLPYTYEAWVDILGGLGRAPIYDHYFSSTICGLIEYLDEFGLQPDEVRLYGIFRGRKNLLSNELLVNEEGCWLKRPELCHVLENHYEITHAECYRGHVEKGPCSFEDRERGGLGPTW